MQALEVGEDEKFNILINRLGLNSYEYVDATTTYKEVVDKLETVYCKKINKIYARWKLANEKQREGESMDAFANRLMILARDCDYTNVTTVEYKKEAVLQSFVSGLEDSYVRQRILEKDVVNLENTLESAEILKRAKLTQVAKKEKNINQQLLRLTDWTLKAQLRRLTDRTQETKKVRKRV